METAITGVGIPLDIYKYSDAGEVRGLVQQLFTQVLDSGAYTTRPKKPQALLDAILITCLNLFAASFTHPGGYVFYSRSRNYYSRKLLSFDLLDQALQGLLKLEYIEHQIGQWKGRNGHSFRSRIRATETLKRLFSKYAVTLPMVSSHRAFPLLRLRDANKKELALPTTGRQGREVRSMGRKLAGINDRLAQALVLLHISDEELERLNARLSLDEHRRVIDFTRKRLYRVFNRGSLRQGGRFYGGWWQSIPSDFRPYIEILMSGERFPRRCREVDYSSMQPALAYANRGMTAPLGEIYLIEAMKDCDDQRRTAIRGVVKQVFLVMLNVESRSRVHGAVYRALAQDYRREHPGEPRALRRLDLLPVGCPPVSDIVRELEERHAVIFDGGYPNIGLKLMYQESQIAQGVMLALAKEGVVALPIHDSFIAPESHASRLDRLMRSEFRAQTGYDIGTDMDDPQPTSEGTARDFEKHSKDFSIYYALWDQWPQPKPITQVELDGRIFSLLELI